MIGVQFVEVGGADKNASTVAALDANMDGFDEDGVYATEMMIWQNGDYTTYGWSGKSGTAYLEDATLDDKWLNDAYQEEVNPLTGGDAFWVKAGSGGTITIVGQVPDGEVTITLASGYNMVANPLPKTVPAATFGKLSAGMAGFDEDGVFATEMMVWENGDYTTYGWSGKSGTAYLDDSTLDDKWLNDAYETTDGVVEAGHAVWIKAGSAGSITFNAD